MSPHLLAVNVGLPRDHTWGGRIVRTGIWKEPVAGRRMARSLNIDGDGQGDLEGHGGEHRAVLVYQLESYRHWEHELGRAESTYGQDLTRGLLSWGVPLSQIHSETFGAGSSLTPGIHEQRPPPHAPAGPPGEGPRVSFARSGLSVAWDSRFQNLLELAEACDVPARWSCRTGVCHNCEVGLIGGSCNYEPDPLDPPASGNLLICCSRPRGDLVIDL